MNQALVRIIPVMVDLQIFFLDFKYYLLIIMNQTTSNFGLLGWNKWAIWISLPTLFSLQHKNNDLQSLAVSLINI